MNGNPAGAISRIYRIGLAIFVALLIFDGAIRKWIFPGAEQLVFVVKDMLLFAVFMLFALQSRNHHTGRMAPGIAISYWAYVLWVAIEAFNSNLPTMLVGLWGLKVHVLYSCLIVLVPSAFGSIENLFRTLERLYPWLVIPVVVLALLQLAAPAYSTVNQTVRGGQEAVSQFGYAGLVRVSGTFSYLSGMAAFVQACILLGIALFLSGARSKMFLVGLGFALLAIPITGSRSVLVIVAAGGTILFIAGALCRLVTGSYAVIAIVLLLGLGALSIRTQDQAWSALAERAESSQGDESRAITVFTNAFEFFDSAGLTGFGSGAANLGAPALVEGKVPFSWLPYGDRFEDESGRIVIELGIIGWVLSLFMRAGFAVWAATLALRAATKDARAGAVMALPVLVMGFYIGSGVFAPPVSSAFYWFAVAVLAMSQREHQAATKKRSGATIRLITATR